jgi:hypothetical protein
MALMNSFFLRQIIAALRLATVDSLPEREENFPQPESISEIAPDIAEAARKSVTPGFFDNLDGYGFREPFYKPRGSKVKIPFKGSAKPVDPAEKIGICVHQTAVEFGTTKKARKAWADRIRGGLLPIDVLEKFGVLEIADSEQVEKAAQRLALHERFWKVPYHFVSLLNGDVLFNNKLSSYTYHGGGANGPLYGWVLEGSFPMLEKNRKSRHSKFDEFVIETGRQGLRLAVLKGREANPNNFRLILPHRAYSKGRRADTGEGIWREIALPVAKELDMTPDYEAKYDTGLWIPKSWDDNAHYDLKGRRVA